ncbi:hypothetical protein PF002_g29819 [Phytophthora fragariae]|uniref:Uncharacterized protein n=3 Tax=Phytophthora fragariae TaxID=53985 RepID=A0A6A3VUJ8_9STRA|nr:hypothetical protein PF003_g21161 [Phytophthora fragariae]KAE9171462.1 hypothetical protein PF002_g29819 [Phytophthora fragariae]
MGKNWLYLMRLKGEPDFGYTVENGGVTDVPFNMAAFRAGIRVGDKVGSRKEPWHRRDDALADSDFVAIQVDRNIDGEKEKLRIRRIRDARTKAAEQDPAAYFRKQVLNNEIPIRAGLRVRLATQKTPASVAAKLHASVQVWVAERQRQEAEHRALLASIVEKEKQHLSTATTTVDTFLESEEETKAGDEDISEVSEPSDAFEPGDDEEKYPGPDCSRGSL